MSHALFCVELDCKLILNKKKENKKDDRSMNIDVLERMTFIDAICYIICIFDEKIIIYLSSLVAEADPKKNKFTEQK